MKVLGIDPSSQFSGGAIVDKGKLKVVMLWFKDDRRSHPHNLYDFFNTVRQWCRDEDPDVACIEALSVTRGAQVTRMIAFYQAAAVLACKKEGVVVIEARVKTARMIVLGNGNMDKEEAYKAVKKMFPEMKFKQFKSGGADQTDANVLAVAGPDVADG